MRSTEKRSSITSRARLAEPAASDRSSSRRPTASAIARESPGATSRPVSLVHQRLRRAADARGHRGRARRHRLEQHVRQRLVERRHHRHVHARQQRRNIGAQPGEDHAIAHAEPGGEVASARSGTAPPSGSSRRRPGSGRRDSAGFSIAAASRRFSSPFRRVSRETTATSGVVAEARARGGSGPGPRVRRSAQVDAVANHDDLRGVVAFADQPVLDRGRIDQHAVGELAGVALHALLHRRQVRRAVADRGDDDRRRQPRGRDGEDVAVEVVGVDDLDRRAGDMPREPRLLRERLDAAERRDLVSEQRDLPRPPAPGRTVPQRRRQANSRSNARGSSRRLSVMNWFSVPPHMSVGTTLRIRTRWSRGAFPVRSASLRARPCAAPARRLARLGAPDVLEGHRQPADAEEIELVGDRVKHRRDEEGDERDLHAGGEHAPDARSAGSRAARRSTARAVRKQSKCSQAKRSRPGRPRSTAYCR